MKEINKYLNMQNNQLSQEYQQLLEEIKKWCADSILLATHQLHMFHWKNIIMSFGDYLYIAFF